MLCYRTIRITYTAPFVNRNIGITPVKKTGYRNCYEIVHLGYWHGFDIRGATICISTRKNERMASEVGGGSCLSIARPGLYRDVDRVFALLGRSEKLNLMEL